MAEHSFTVLAVYPGNYDVTHPVSGAGHNFNELGTYDLDLSGAQTLYVSDNDGDAWLNDNNNAGGYDNGADGGKQMLSQAIDGLDPADNYEVYSLLKFGVTITLSDGSTMTTTAYRIMVDQDPFNTKSGAPNGHVATREYLAFDDEIPGNATQITFNTRDGNGRAEYDSLTTWGPDYIVEGSPGNDLIDINYTGDPEGDRIDNNDGNPSSPGVGDDDLVYGYEGNDTIRPNVGDDTVFGGVGDDSISGGLGNDSLEGGTGDDFIGGGVGNDTIKAGEGDDSVRGGDGNDSIYGYEGSDTVDGGAGDDYINTRTSPGTGVPDVGLDHPDGTTYDYPADADPNNDRDSVDGGTGNDTILTGDDDDTITGGDGNDVIDAGFDDDTVSGGGGADSIQGSEGNDTIDGGDGDDVIYGGVSPLDPNYAIAQNYDLEDAGVNTSADPVTNNNSDSLVGGAGDDRIYGQDDSDTLEGGTGNDLLDGGIDNDSLDGGDGSDTLTGGQGDDVFIVSGGNDTITDFGEGITGPIDEGQGVPSAQDNNDFVDLGSYYSQANYDAAVTAGHIDPNIIKNPLQWLRSDHADGVLNDTYAGWDVNNTLTIENGGSAVAGTDLTWDTTNVICFVRGTRIATADGEIYVENLKVGDRVITHDNGIRKIRWIGATKRDAVGSLAPVLFKAGSIGNHSDLFVSPNHRILVKDEAAELWVGDNEVLIPAKFMVNDDDIVTVEGGIVEYYHILFDTHEIVLSEGCWSESFHPGHVGWGTLCEDTRQEILDLYPELEDMQSAEGWTTARKVLKQKEAKVILASIVQ